MSAQPDYRIVRRALGWDMTPVQALALVRADPHPVALIGAWAHGSDIIGSEPLLVRSPPQSLSDVLDSAWPTWARGQGGDQREAKVDSDAFSALRSGQPDWPTAASAANGPASGGPGGQGPGGIAPAFGGGWIGYLGYGLAGEILRVPPPPGPPGRLPAWWFGYYDHILRHDRATGSWSFEALWTPGRADALERRFDELSGRPRATAERPGAYRCGGFRTVPGAAEHKAAVRRAIELIRAGDIFQANICLRLEADFEGDPLDAFCRAVTRLSPPFAAFLRLGDGAVASLSPELFLRRTGRTVLSRPIKGTLHRSDRDLQATLQRRDLEQSAKNRAENVMIVDLMRNDLSRVCVPGSVRVPRLLQVEAHPGVWHLVSEIGGTLAPASGDGDLLRAAFPPGSVTGAPKIRAMEVIHELEAMPREIYTGAVGYRSPVAGLELNVAIRTFEFHRGRVWLGAGGGVVADSAETEEYRECLLKARPLIRALGGRLCRESSPAADVTAVSGPMRPRPAAGVFTSLPVIAGTTRGLADHLARLEASTRRLYGMRLPSSLRGELAERLRERPTGDLRITAKPLGGPLHAAVDIAPSEPLPGAVKLRPAVIPGGLGAHKWQDRRLLGHLAKTVTLAPDEHLLIEDSDGDLLETDRANLFAVIGGVLHTPPEDGRLLPGITRAAVLRIATAEGMAISVARLPNALLPTATEVFVSNSGCGVLPVRSISGTPVSWGDGPVTACMAAALARQPAARGASAAGRASRCRPAIAAPLRGAKPRPVVVLVDNHDSFTYNLVHMLLAAGSGVEVVRNDEVSAEQVASFGPDGIVISPGPCTPAEAGISVDVVLACGHAAPLLGICLGHQAIAAAYGARIVRAPQPVHGQTSLIAHDGKGVLSGLPPRFAAARYHSLQVDEASLPPVLAVTARTSGQIPMALRHVEHAIEGLQFHPESILTTSGELIIRNFTAAIRRTAT